jgi:hypothetical protein
VPQPKCRFINPATGNQVGSIVECDTDKLRRFVLAGGLPANVRDPGQTLRLEKRWHGRSAASFELLLRLKPDFVRLGTTIGQPNFAR